MHWTGIYQSWNNQCADCHSTGLERNYDAQSDTYNTTWDHAAVSCIACHETAQAHAEAKLQDRSLGSGVDLAAMGAWLVSEGSRPPRHTGESSKGCPGDYLRALPLVENQSGGHIGRPGP